MKSFEFKLVDNSELVRKASDAAIKRALEACGLHIEGEAKQELENKPRRVDTGLLRNSITHALSGEAPAARKYTASEPNEKGEIPSGAYSGTAPEAQQKSSVAVYIGTNVEYAIYVHEGTRRMAPNRFLKNAITKNIDQLREFVIDELKKG